mgnify:FL=1
MRFIINENIPLICNYPKGLKRISNKYVNPKLYGQIKTFTNNDR